jgi:2'-5' RNA ligase
MPEPRQRVFFALWPEPEVARALYAAGRLAHETCGGRVMRRDTLHMTLAFLGDVEDARLEAACEAATEAAAKVPPSASNESGFADRNNADYRRPVVGAGDTAMAVDRLGYWGHNHIVWAGCGDTPPALLFLADELAGRLRSRGFRIESRPFVAHATLLRHARCGGDLPALPPIAWPVHDFVLVVSEPAPEGPHYRVLRRWPLG